MAKRPDAAKQGYWRDVIERHRASGLSIREFCQIEGISEARFHWWRRQVRPAVSSGKSTIRSKSGKPKLPARSSTPRFLPVEVTPSVEAAAVEVVLPGGTLVRIRPGADLRWLRELLGALEQRPC